MGNFYTSAFFFWIVFFYLIFTSVEFIAVLEEELIGGLETGRGAIFDDSAGSWRRTELLHLKKSCRKWHERKKKLISQIQVLIRYS